jgi:hypothetical protein
MPFLTSALPNAIAVFLAALFLSFGVFAQAPVELASPAIGQPAPAFSGTDANGNKVSLGDFAGKTVVLEWTNHECPFVKKHYDSGSMQKLQKEATDNGVIWLSIVSSAPDHQGYTIPEEAKAVIEKTGSHATARILDSSGEIGRLYGAKTTPHMFIVDKNGTLVYAGGIDDMPSTDPKTLESAKNYVRAALDDIAAGRPVATAQTQPYGCSVKYSD